MSLEPHLGEPLYAFLKRIEDEKPTGLVRVRSSAGDVVGSFMASGGRLCFASAARSLRPKARSPEDQSLVTKLHRALDDARDRGVRLSEAILACNASDAAAVRRALRIETSRAILDIVDACEGAGWQHEVRETRDDYDPRLTFAPVDVFLAASESLDQLPVDTAKRFYQEFSGAADVALLFMRGFEEGALPAPIAARGLEESKLDDLAATAHAAFLICRPAALASCGVELTAGVRVVEDGIWIQASGALRFALLRAPREKLIVGRIVRRAFHLTNHARD